MNLTKGIETQSRDVLHSGRFYWVHRVSRCYRINEVDHFLKDLTIDLLCYLDHQGAFHHFNRPESRFPAVTSFEEVLGVPNITTLECFEFTQKTLDELKQGEIEPSKEAVVLLKKIVAVFYDQQKNEEVVEFSLEKWKSSHMKEYIHSNELQN